MNPETSGIILFGILAILLIGGIFFSLTYFGKQDSCLKLSCPSTSSYFGIKESKQFYSCKCPLPQNADKKNALCFISSQQAESQNLTRVQC